MTIDKRKIRNPVSGSYKILAIDVKFFDKYEIFGKDIFSARAGSEVWQIAWYALD